MNASSVSNVPDNLAEINWDSFKWLLLAGISTFQYFMWSNTKFSRLIDALPGPKPFPVIGNLLDFRKIYDEGFVKIIAVDWIKKYGAICRFWIGSVPFVVLSSPELVEVILSSHKLVTKAAEYSYASAWIGNGLVLSTGTQWRKRRRLLLPTIHSRVLNSFIEVFNEKSADCAREFERAIENNGGNEIDVFPFMTHCTLDIICESSMGKQTRSEQEKLSYVRNVGRVMKIFTERAVRPWLASDFIFNHFSALGHESKKCIRALHDFTNQIIRDRRKTLSWAGEVLNNNVEKDNFHKPANERLAFLDLLIKASENGTVLSDNDIRGEVDSFMMAGHDTTASCTSWFLYCVAKHPKKQQMIVDELNYVFGDSKRSCTTQDLAELKYLECCIKETLRLYPPGPTVVRWLTEDVEIGGYKLPTGVRVAINIYGIHHSPLYYPDPESFIPERFLPENSVGRHPCAFLSFSAGPRNCIGKQFAMLEVKVVLANLLRQFRFSVLDNSKPMIIPKMKILFRPTDGVNLVVTKRYDIGRDNHAA